MLPFRYISDIHLENKVNKIKIKNLGLDTLILAGDIGIVKNREKWIDFMYMCKEQFKNIIYVTGNHEYWDSTIDDVDCFLENLSEKWKNFHYLNNKGIFIDNKFYYGTTFWTNIDEKKTDNMDNKRIISFDYKKRNKLYYQSLEELKKLKYSDYIITHFPPVEYPLHYKSRYNRFYTHHHPELLVKCDKWICGHLHRYVPHPKLLMNPYKNEYLDMLLK